jgi:hypothetical protein
VPLLGNQVAERQLAAYDVERRKHGKINWVNFNQKMGYNKDSSATKMLKLIHDKHK